MGRLGDRLDRRVAASARVTIHSILNATTREHNDAGADAAEVPIANGERPVFAEFSFADLDVLLNLSILRPRHRKPK